MKKLKTQVHNSNTETSPNFNIVTKIVGKLDLIFYNQYNKDPFVVGIKGSVSINNEELNSLQVPVVLAALHYWREQCVNVCGVSGESICQDSFEVQISWEVNTCLSHLRRLQIFPRFPTLLSPAHMCTQTHKTSHQC